MSKTQGQYVQCVTAVSYCLVSHGGTGDPWPGQVPWLEMAVALTLNCLVMKGDQNRSADLAPLNLSIPFTQIRFQILFQEDCPS